MVIDLQVIHPSATPDQPSRSLQRPQTSAVELLGFRIDKVTLEDTLEWAARAAASRQPHQVVTLNPLMILDALKDTELAEIITASPMVVPESSGVYWACRQMGTPIEGFVPGIDVMQAFCHLARNSSRSVFLLGARLGVAAAAAQVLKVMFPGLNVVGTYPGYFASAEEEKAVIDKIRQAAPDFLFVAMSVPGQEKWIRRNLDALGVSVVMGVGGSFDVLSGGLRRAPVWMRDLGLEWLFRTLQEPWRFKRVMHLPIFVWKILRS